MSSDMSSLELGADEIRERNGELQLVKGLNESRFEAICVLLQGQSHAHMRDFETSVARLMKRGYQLTSWLPCGYRCPKDMDLDRPPEDRGKAQENEPMRTLKALTLLTVMIIAIKLGYPETATLPEAQ